ncbi:MAG: helix-turn-helix domain-containing protein, partial [Nitrospirales bacterium]
RSEGGDRTSSPIRSGRSLKEAVEELEKRMIGDALRWCQHNQLQTAKALGLSRQGLIKKMKRYGLKSS